MSQPVPAEPWPQPRLSAPPGHAAWLGKRCKTALGSPSIYFSLLIEGAPFVGDHANDDNLLQKGRPLIMRLQLLRVVSVNAAGPSETFHAPAS